MGYAILRSRQPKTPKTKWAINILDFDNASVIFLSHSVDAGGFAMNENAAYGPVTAASQQPDCIYAQPGGHIESEYHTVK